MIALHPDTGTTFAAQRNAELIAEARHEALLREIGGRSTGHRLTVATGRLLERTGARMQGIPAGLTLPHRRS